MTMPERRAEDVIATVALLDPTERTLATLEREICNVSERLETRIRAEARLDNEKFAKVDREFELIERQRVEQKRDTKEAVDAALIAQKEAVREQTLASEKAIAKSEAATAKQIDALNASFTQAMAAQSTSLTDLKDRVVAIESGGQGRSYERNEHRLNTGQLTAAISAGLLAVSILASTLIAVLHK
jgi:hypothetical protein